MIYGNMKEHKYEVEGIKPQIMTEVTNLLHICYKKGLFNKDDLTKMVELAQMSDDDMQKEAMNKLDSTMTAALNKMFDDAAHGKQEAIDVLAMLTDMMLKDMRDKKREDGSNK